MTDLSLERALNELRQTLRGMQHGRCVLVVEKHGGRVLQHWIDVDLLTTTDVDRLMRERPHAERRVDAD